MTIKIIQNYFFIGLIKTKEISKTNEEMCTACFPAWLKQIMRDKNVGITS